MVLKALVAGRDRAIDDQQVVAAVLLHRRLARLLRGVTRGGLQRVLVVERDALSKIRLSRVGRVPA